MFGKCAEQGFFINSLFYSYNKYLVYFYIMLVSLLWDVGVKHCITSCCNEAHIIVQETVNWIRYIHQIVTKFLKQKTQNKGKIYIEVNGAILNRAISEVFLKDVTSEQETPGYEESWGMNVPERWMTSWRPWDRRMFEKSRGSKKANIARESKGEIRIV